MSSVEREGGSTKIYRVLTTTIEEGRRIRSGHNAGIPTRDSEIRKRGDIRKEGQKSQRSEKL